MHNAAPFTLGTLLATAVASIIALFFARDATQTWDVLKLSVQGVGALIFARYGVVWALETFKSQKRWERDAATYSNVLAALREMNRTNDLLWQEAIGARQYSEDYLEEVRIRWRTAKKRFEDAAAASIFLPDEISSIILQLEADFANAPRHNTYQGYLDHDAGLLSNAIKDLEQRKTLL
ncbi:MAG: hypothetical protein QHD01_12405 [Bradyrhizobium sp.]|uniref:hypothetical protein n=1 Tax=Bradyrhizobium sp. TaxID=376 RepID=UPI0029A6136F|nr:hypothetical protein [Bradyrhizobium sp.]MDX3967389.1 hypothetical protein [Bradyrhizobium sp.]